ncbi:DUF4082 domain-containing protein [Mariniflexile gromovii]|uniref:DUF4082 domain-containing protein n=1 Tax=Mariniflexile gromovii TaxID=362523 RepID=A0ABS4BQU0_9FLAO|nr:DUF4082 domain-containing protein [Mariniflexile gromovii]MBP0902440.1 DUF4082 domain-containing protein [Mariniflexile gromovii]
MKAQKLIKALLLLAIVLSSCSKKDDDIITEIPSQYPMKSLIESGYIGLQNTMVDWEFIKEVGYRFKTFKSGSITSLGIRIPNNGEYRVTLFNADTEEVLVTKYITSTSGLLSYEEIDPINIQSGVAYFVSVNTNNFYTFNDSGNTIFPVEIGDVLITNSGSSTGNNINQLMPSLGSNTYFIGMVDVKFKASN